MQQEQFHGGVFIAAASSDQQVPIIVEEPELAQGKTEQRDTSRGRRRSRRSRSDGRRRRRKIKRGRRSKSSSSSSRRSRDTRVHVQELARVAQVEREHAEVRHRLDVFMDL